MSSEITTKGKTAKKSSLILANVSAEIKNRALLEIGIALDKNRNAIKEANAIDIQAAQGKISAAMIDRLTLNDKCIDSMIEGLNKIIELDDPVGEIQGEWMRPNGLLIKKIRVPLGVVAIIYESRPNVTVDSAALCLKAGNAVILRGGSSAINSNICLAKIIAEAAERSGIPGHAIQIIEDTNRQSAVELMQAREYIDVLIPRGGKDLIQSVVQNSKIPVIETGEGNCHAYVEKTADLSMAAEIVYNAKVSRPSVCNAIETLLIDETIAEKAIPLIFRGLKAAKVEIRGDEKIAAIDPSVVPATETDWSTEFLSLVLAVKVVSGVDEAIDHINKYGTKHSETIITCDDKAAEKFCNGIDASALYVNASTRFTDGFEFGFGAEIGISTQKLHCRGPMGLSELTSYKYIVKGNGQVRNL